MSNKSEIVEKYISNLRDLKYNSKLLIVTLTQSAKENIKYAEDIFGAIKSRLAEVPTETKLPVLYLIDSIIKNVGGIYRILFCNNIVSILHRVFLQVDKNDRDKMRRLRKSWNGFISPNKLNALDTIIGRMDPALSVGIPLPAISAHSNYLNKPVAAVSEDNTRPTLMVPELETTSTDPKIISLQQKIVDIQRQLLEVQERKLELDCMEARLKLQQAAVDQNINAVGAPSSALMPNIIQLQTTSAEREKTEASLKDGTSPAAPAHNIVSNARSVTDPRVYRQQHWQPNHTNVPDMDSNSEISLLDFVINDDRNNQIEKNPSWHDCSTKIIRKSRDLIPVPSAIPRKRPSSENLEFSTINKKVKREIFNYSSCEATPSKDSDTQPMSPPCVFSKTEEKPKALSEDLRNCLQKLPEILSMQSESLQSLCLQAISNNGFEPKSYDTKVEESVNYVKSDRFKADRVSTVYPQRRELDKTYSKYPWTCENSRQENFRRGQQTQNTWRTESNCTSKLYFNGDLQKTEHIATADRLSLTAEDTREAFYNKPFVRNSNHRCEEFPAKDNRYRVPSGIHSKQPFSLPHMKPSFDNPQSLKVRHMPAIKTLHQGQKCSNCGLRFTPEQSAEYKEHLDWHFRQNRKAKTNKIFRRSWNFPLSDWINYQEVEDLEEREKNYFEEQKESEDSSEENIETPCVRAGANVYNAHCEVCHDKFEQFYNEEDDEWQLRMAVRVDDKIYHPLCYSNY